MTRREQKKFVRSLTRSVAASVVQHINDGKIPDGWDGHELRALLAEKFHREAESPSFTGKRKSEFKNHVLVNYLD